MSVGAEASALGGVRVAVITAPRLRRWSRHFIAASQCY